MDEIFKRISEQWFLREPAFFALYCMHQLQENTHMKVPVRCGQHRIEYNPDLLKNKSQAQIDLLLRIELIRLFLKHPYERQPDDVSRTALALGSDCVIAEGYEEDNLDLMRPQDFKLEGGQYFERYARDIDELLGGNGAPSEDASAEGEPDPNAPQLPPKPIDENIHQKSELWQEDSMAAQEVNDLIKSLSNWGSIPGRMVQQIQASTEARIDYRLIMQGFRSHILSSKRRLTRMRPNRRTGFDQMGSQRRFNTSLLVAVDVSGSISNRTLSRFYGVVNRFFKYGFDEIDCVQFDCELGPVRSLRKASRQVEVTGRGGTSFQPVFDYLVDHQQYDGLVILTDGGAPHPKVDPTVKTKVLWVCENERSYQECKDWMQLFGRVCWMML